MNLAAGHVPEVVPQRAPLCGGTWSDIFPLRATVDSTKTGLPSSDHFVGSGIAPTALSSNVSQNGWLHASFDASDAASRPAATASVAASRAPRGSPPPPP